MLELTLRRIPFTAESESRLRVLKARTGLDRNYICRMGFCLSLEEPGIPAIIAGKAQEGREIDRYTLLGEYAAAFISLLLIWMSRNAASLGSNDLDSWFVAHMNRGVEIISARIRSLADMGSLLAGEAGSRYAPFEE